VKAVPNILSVFRICLVPVFFVTYFYDDHDIKLYAVLVYGVASLSDILDGFVARKFKASSNLGKVLDPLGDKLMTFSVMICITIDRVIPVWAVVIAGTKEVLMAVGGLILHKLAKVEIPPSNILGKASTVVFFLVCATLMLFRTIPENVATTLITLAIVLTGVALGSYISTYITVMKNREKS